MKKILGIAGLFLLIPIIVLAQSKITALTNDASPTTDDLVVTVNDPGGTPATRKATIANVLVDSNIPNNITIDLATTATALASNPTDCVLNQFANTIAANGNLTCGAIADADVPNDITINNATTATALASNPSDCAANQFADSIVASGNLGCNAIIDADVPNTITIDLSSAATALAADPTDCSAGSYTIGINASGTAQGCTDATTEIDSSILTHKNVAAAHHTATVNTNAETICGNDLFLNGDGTCDAMSGGISAGDNVTWTGAHTFSSTFTLDALSTTAGVLDVDNTINVDFISSTGGTTTIENTLYVESSGGSSVTFSTVDADPCTTIGEGGMFYNGANFCYCDGTNDVLIWDNTVACF